MPTAYLTPNGDVSIGSWQATAGGTSNLYAEVDDWHNDSDYIRLAEAQTSTVIFDLDMPVSDIGAVTDIQYQLYVMNEIDFLPATVVDVQILDSSNAAIATSASSLTGITDIESVFTLRTVSTNSLSGSQNQTRWNGARLRINAQTDNGPGTKRLKISAVRVQITYTAAGGNYTESITLGQAGSAGVGVSVQAQSAMSLQAVGSASDGGAAGLLSSMSTETHAGTQSSATSVILGNALLPAGTQLDGSSAVALLAESVIQNVSSAIAESVRGVNVSAEIESGSNADAHYQLALAGAINLITSVEFSLISNLTAAVVMSLDGFTGFNIDERADLKTQMVVSPMLGVGFVGGSDFTDSVTLDGGANASANPTNTVSQGILLALHSMLQNASVMAGASAVSISQKSGFSAASMQSIQSSIVIGIGQRLAAAASVGTAVSFSIQCLNAITVSVKNSALGQLLVASGIDLDQDSRLNAGSRATIVGKSGLANGASADYRRSILIAARESINSHAN